MKLITIEIYSDSHIVFIETNIIILSKSSFRSFFMNNFFNNTSIDNNIPTQYTSAIIFLNNSFKLEFMLNKSNNLKKSFYNILLVL